MKVLVVGDQHLRFELPYSSAFSDGRRGEWEQVKAKIHKTAEDCDAVVLLGDNLNARHNHSTVIKEFIDFLNGFGDKEVHILVGNHERYGKATALDFLKEIPTRNWFVYTEPTRETIAGYPSMLIPFMNPALLGVETKEEAIEAIMNSFPKEKIKLAFLHHAVSGMKIGDFPIDLTNEMVLHKDKLNKHFDITFAGHIHNKHIIDQSTIVTGSIFTQNVGEHEKSIWIYEDGKVTEVPLPVRSIFKMIWEEQGEKHYPKHSIVKCYITSRNTDIEVVKEFLNYFDSYVVIEQYPSERTKVHFEKGLDLSVENLLKLFAEAKDLDYAELKAGFELLRK